MYRCSDYLQSGSFFCCMSGARRVKLLMFLMLNLTGVTTVRAELYFNISALRLTPEQKAAADLDALARPDVQVPGEYRVQVNVNGARNGEYTLNFVLCGSRLCPELTPVLLKEFGIKVGGFPALSAMSQEATLNDISAFIPQAEYELDFDRRVLKLSIPQAAMDNRARGDIPPEQWEDGLPMLFSSYSLSGTETRRTESLGNYGSQYLNLRSGVNAGPWRLRNYSYYNRTRSGVNQWDSMQTWLERDIRALRARFVAGETATPGLVTDSFSFRGVYLSTQDEMLADSQRGYAPEILGIAMTNATVEIRQNGSLLYQTFVPPGPFSISDLYPTSTSGDLEITVREEDGTIRTSTQPFASPAVSVRRGMMKYSVTAGEYGQRNNNEKTVENQRFVQGELLYGWLSNTTLYGGALSAEHYHSGTFGAGAGMGRLGAISLDVTHARTRFGSRETAAGESWRMRYSKRFDLTGTNMTLAGYRYNTAGYYSFDEASNWYHYGNLADRYALKNKAQLTLSQNLGAPGSVSLSAWQQDYRHHGMDRTRSVTANWSKSFNGVTVSLSHNQNRNWRKGRTDNVSSATVSLPVGKWLSPSGQANVRLSNNWSHSDTGNASFSSTLSGTALENNTLSWSVAQARSRQSNGNVTNSSALAGTLQGSRSVASLGYANYYGQRESINWSLRGSVVAHPYGVTLSRQLSEGSAWALIKAPGAKDVKVRNRSGLSTDARGYAVVPSLTPYRENEISLDTATLGNDVDLADAIRHKIPARESLVLAEYNANVGNRVFLTLTRQGKPLPLGSTVNTGEISGITDERGRVYLAGVPDITDLVATLSDGERCRASFTSIGKARNNGIVMAGLQCE